MTLRRGLLPVLAAGLGLVGCARAGPQVASSHPLPAAPPLIDLPRRPGKPLLLVAMPDSASFRAVRGAMLNEVKKEFDVATLLVEARSGAGELTAQIARRRPDCLVLMDNRSVTLYRELRNRSARTAPLPPVVVVMAPFLEDLRAQLENVTGVAYEVPGVTAFVNLRAVIERPVTRVGVIHRPTFRRLIQREKILASKEQIELVAVEVSAEVGPSAVQLALRQLRTSRTVDALWVLNDDSLLRDAAFLEIAWRQEINALGVPVIVGAPTLVLAEARFGNFAVFPDPGGVGAQAASVVFALSEAGWRTEDVPIELPFSTLTVVNVGQIRRNYGLRKGATQRIDQVVE